jgi:ADP-heptose:LPS heptosyltransferase
MKWLDKYIFRRNELDALLTKASKGHSIKFLIIWNRGLGDIALGLYALVHRIRDFIPDSQITFLTRTELEDGFRLLDGARVITAPWWQRGTQIDLNETMARLAIHINDYDEILESINPTKWLSWQIGKVVPRLKWDEENDCLCERFHLGPKRDYIGVHVSSETAQFYKYQKDWPTDNWKELFNRLAEKTDCRIILFGHNKEEEFISPAIVDLRGETGLLEMLSIIKKHCSILIAPDGGILSIIYYLDTYFPIRVISLWGDARQGVLKQGVASPNKGLEHFSVVGKNNMVAEISVDEILDKIISYNKN